MTPWIVIIIAGTGTFLFRISLVAVFSGRDAPPWLERSAGYVVPTAFAALAAISLSVPAGGGLGEAAPPLIAAAVTATVALRSTAPTALAAGLPALWISSALLTSM